MRFFLSTAAGVSVLLSNAIKVRHDPAAPMQPDPNAPNPPPPTTGGNGDGHVDPATGGHPPVPPTTGGNGQHHQPAGGACGTFTCGPTHTDECPPCGGKGKNDGVPPTDPAAAGGSSYDPAATAGGHGPAGGFDKMVKDAGCEAECPAVCATCAPKCQDSASAECTTCATENGCEACKTCMDDADDGHDAASGYTLLSKKRHPPVPPAGDANAPAHPPAGAKGPKPPKGPCGTWTCGETGVEDCGPCPDGGNQDGTVAGDAPVPPAAPVVPPTQPAGDAPAGDAAVPPVPPTQPAGDAPAGDATVPPVPPTQPAGDAPAGDAAVPPAAQ